MNLYDISQEILDLNARLDDVEGDADERAVLAEWWLALELELEAKVDRTLAYAAELAARGKARAEEAARLTALASADDARAQRLRDAVKAAMEAASLKRLATPRFNATVAGNGGPMPLQIDVPTDELPWDCVKTVSTPDKEALRERLLRGETINGVSLKERGTHLKVK